MVFTAHLSQQICTNFEMSVARILCTASGVCLLDEKQAVTYAFPWDKKILASLQNAESVEASTVCYSHTQRVGIQCS
jgi:hypothetical protein